MKTPPPHCMLRLVAAILSLFAIDRVGRADASGTVDKPARSAERETAERPNLVVFLVDDMGWQDTSVAFGSEPTYWNRTYRTPHMERLAEEGTTFTDAYAACCVCTPTRTALISGLHPARTRITNWTAGVGKRDGNSLMLCPEDWRSQGLQPGDGFPKLPEILAAHGYRTIHGGKAHLGAAETAGADPTSFGFQVNIGGSRHGSPAGYYPNDRWGTNHPGLEAYLGTEVDLQTAITREANAAVDAAIADGKPFFLHLSHYAVHTPLEPIRDHVQAYVDMGLPEIETRYASMIESMDASLGAVLANLEEEGVLDNTIILFMSDNGGLSNHTRATRGTPYVRDRHNSPLRSGKGAAYEGGTRVPFIVWMPGRKQVGRCARPVITMDVFPTLLAWAGVPPAERPTSDGMLLDDYLTGADPERVREPRPLFWHYPHQWYRDLGVGEGIEPHSSLRLGRWKLYYFYSDQRWELYDLQDDLSETNDLAAARPTRVRQLGKALIELLQDSDAQMPLLREGGEPVPHPVLPN